MIGNGSSGAITLRAFTTRSSPFEILHDCLPGAFQLRVGGSWDMTRYQGTGKVSFGALNLHIEPDPGINLLPTAVDLCLYRNQETEPEQVLPMPWAVDLYRDQGYAYIYNEQDFETACTLEKGDTLVAAVRITDDHGQTTWTVLEACCFSDGFSPDMPQPIDVSPDWVPGQAV